MSNPLDAALFQAIAGGDVQKVMSLLDEGADPNAVDDQYGTTALRDAVDGADDDTEHSDIVRVLLERGADPSQDTPLLSAAYHRYTDTVRLLLAHGVDPNQTCDEGSALFSADQHGYTEIVAMLRAAGAHD